MKDSNSENNINTNIRALPSSSKFSIPMMETLASLMKSHNPLKLTQDELGRANTLGIPILTLGDDDTKIKDIV